MRRDIRPLNQILAATVVVLSMATLWAATEASAEEGTRTEAEERTRYNGTYKYGKSLDHGRRIVRKAMEQAIDQLNPLVRGLARRRLASSDPLVHTITITVAGDRVTVKLVGQKTASFTTKIGATEKVTNPEGKQVDLTHRFTKEGLEQVFVGPKGSSRTVYSLQPDDRQLVVSTTMKGQQLDTPISYRLVYVKQ